MKNALKRRLSALLVVLSFTGSLKAQETAQPKSPTEILAEACDNALTDQLEVNKIQAALIDQLKIASEVRQQRILELERQSGAWYNRPELMGLLGLAAGLIAGGIIAK